MDENTNATQETNKAEGTKEEQTQPKEPETKPQMSVEEQLADMQEKFNTLMVEHAKLKRQNDKAASEAADWKKKYRSTQSEKEVLDAEKAEEEARKAAEYEDMKRRLETSELREQFLTLGYTREQAEKAANAQIDGDVDTLLKIQQQFTKDKVEAEKQRIYAELPQPNIGTSGGQGYTLEQFENMSMMERTKLLRENKAEYDRLLNLSKGKK